MAAVRIQSVSKSFGDNRRALDKISLTIEPGEMVALIGSSGSGKSTLLRHVSGLISADRGRDSLVEVLGKPVQSEGRISPLCKQARRQIGFVFQQFNLVGRLSVLTNVLAGSLARIPLWRGYLGIFSKAEKHRAIEALDRVGIARTAGQRASTLSGGQQQRAAIARALFQGAKIILADEPIASLDPASSKRVMEYLARINGEDGITVMVSLHQVEYAVKYCPRTIALRAGRIVYDGPSEVLSPEFLREIYGADSGELLSQTPQTAKPAANQSNPDLVLAGI